MHLRRVLPRSIKQALRRAYHGTIGPVRGQARPRGGDLSAAVPFRYAPGSAALPDRSIGVVCHLFHDELAGEMRRHLEHIPTATDLYLSTDTDIKAAAIATAFEGWTKGIVDIRLAPNRGRDIAPKLVTFADVYDRHDLILFLHGKKSLTSSIGDDWRRVLTTTLVGSPAIVTSILAIFTRRAEIGIVMSQHFEPIRNLLHWDGNFEHGRRLAARMGFALKRRHVLELTSGSMFWARSAALRPLLDLHLTLEDFPEESNQVRGTNQHAIERLFLFACERAGYGWVKVAAPACFDDHARLETIASPSDLDEFVDRSRFDLLTPAERSAP